MRFRFETGSRQHLENDSLEELTKKLVCSFSGLCICAFYSFLCSVRGVPRPFPAGPPPTLRLLEAPGRSLTTPSSPAGRGLRGGGAELFLEVGWGEG